MKGLVAIGLTPVSLSAAFFFTISISLTVWGAFYEPGIMKPGYLNYLKNISWSVSVLAIFPLFVGLTLKYYNEIPKLFDDLSATFKDEEKEKYSEFIKRVNGEFNKPLLPLFFLLLTIFLSCFYYYRILNAEPHLSWISSGEILQSILKTKSGFTYLGLYSAVIQTFLIYWTFNVVWRSFILSWGLHLFFNEYKFSVKVEPLHSDGCCGLKKIGDVGTIFNGILFLLGIYLSLKVIDKILIQNLPLDSNIGNPIFLGCYAVLAPALFFLPLGAAHKRMKSQKEEFLKPITTKLSKLIQQVETESSLENYEEITKLDDLLKKLNKKISVWPFNFRSLEAFFGTVVIPILPIILPFIFKLVSELIK